MITKYPFVNLIILDGWGVSAEKQGNAIAAAKTPFYDSLIANCRSTKISASSDAVGLNWGEPGNSEVGHLNLGAGRVVWQDLPRIDRGILDKSFFENPAFLDASRHVKKNNSKLHLLGIVSSGGVHGHIKHLIALLRFAKSEKIKNVFIHMITDGRDSRPRETRVYLKKINEKIKKYRLGEIATIIGRFYAMDRDNRWERIQTTYNALVYAKGQIANTPEDAINNAYNQGQTDEFIKPQIIVDESLRPKATIQENDAVIFFNFRADRARQLNRTFTDPQFNKFPVYHYKNLFFVAMAQYEKGTLIERVAFPPQVLKNTLPEVLARNNLKQFHASETEKYAHVTYFFNGGVEKTYLGESRAIIPSPKVDTYDQKPEMSADKLTAEIVKRINEKKYQFILANYPNCDMVGHTGNFEATVKAIEYLDKCLNQLILAAIKTGSATIVTADHGNAEQMIDPRKKIYLKEHSGNPVPFILVTPEQKFQDQTSNQEKIESFTTSNPTGILADVAPTVLELLGLPQPPEMDGMSLLQNLT